MATKKRKTKKTQQKQKSLLQLDIAFGSPSLTQKVLLAKNLSVMLQSGMTLVDALSATQESLQGKLRTVLKQVIEDVESGVLLSDSFAKYPKVFPEVFVNVTRAGESSGTLAENLEVIARQLKKDKDLVSKVRGAMVYPIIILVATFFLGMGVAFFVLPEIVPLFQGLDVELPVTTRALIAFSDVVESHGLPLFAAIVGGFIFLFWLLRQRFSRPATHWIMIKLPVIKKIVRYANLARFASTLGTSLKSGITIDEALDITRRSVGNYYYQKELARVAQKVHSGAKLSTELARAHHLFPVILIRMLKVGEESGKVEDTMLYLAGFYEEEVDASVKSFTTLLEPMLLLFIGAMVGFLALSIITPIYDITGNVQK